MYREVHSLVDDYIQYYGRVKGNFQMLDATFGGGNHSIPLLDKYKELKVLGTDLDNKVLEECR